MAAVRQRGWSLLIWFGVTSLVPIVVLGFVLGRTVRHSIEQRALDVYTAESEAVLNIFVRTLLREEDFRAAMPPDRVAMLKGLMGELPAPDGTGVHVRLVNPDGLVVFSTAESEVGDRVDVTPLAAALAGQSSTTYTGAVTAGDPSYRMLRLHQPVRIDPAGRVVGALDVTAPDTVVAPTIANDVRRIQLTLAGGLAVLWVCLLPIAGRAARALRRQAEDSEHLALHDPLTGLPNRALFADRLERAVAQARRSGRRAALLLLDLDGFKDVNDSLGHEHGDVVLRHAATLLSGAVRECDTVARLGGDEFAVVLPEVADRASVSKVAERLEAALDRPLSVGGLDVAVRASMGAAVYPDDAEDADALLDRADAAMYDAKDSGATFRTPEPTGSAGRSRVALVADLRSALAARTGLVLHHQPVVAADGTPQGTEALVRWDHPTLGLLPPAVFLRRAEQAGLARDLTRRVIDLALADCRAWAADGLDLWVAVNLSSRNLREPDLAEHVAALLSRHRLPPSRLVLELTDDVAPAAGVVERLRALGVGIALDGFGTPSSSLVALQHVPGDVVKVDARFAVRLPQVVGLAHELGWRVAAHRVETPAQRRRMVELGCDRLQGFAVADPMPAGAVPGWVAGDRPAVSLGR